ncbi:hypothetical protein EW026_g1601 [Hermanssonia centrifuga]|uniref:RNA-binding S4 domain-containing protein n=1 Tax=Hermanssonia centrifuga TaxID=98765 RepID=A0A4S4KQY4_9APHY|nr:hypothetical protein EW026_g1601 [Hermanssonia centrifuga]
MARSVYDARRLVIHGKVLLNGKKHTAANTRLAPGDMVTVDPAAIPFLQRPARAKAKETSDVKASSESESSETDESGVFSTKPILKEDSKYKQTQTYFKLPSYAAPFIFIPAYLEVSFATCSAIYLRHPTARPGYSELPTPYAADGDIINFAWEWQPADL